MGAKPICNLNAEQLTGKKILNLNNDNIHYTRLIMGSPYQKSLYGTPYGIILSDFPKS